MATIELPTKRDPRKHSNNCEELVECSRKSSELLVSQNFCCFVSGVSVNVYPQILTHNRQTTAPWEKFTINLNWN